MRLKTVAGAALAAIICTTLALPAQALNPQPLPPKEGRAWLLKRQPIEAKKHIIRRVGR